MSVERLNQSTRQYLPDLISILTSLCLCAFVRNNPQRKSVLTIPNPIVWPQPQSATKKASHKGSKTQRLLQNHVSRKVNQSTRQYLPDLIAILTSLCLCAFVRNNSATKICPNDPQSHRLAPTSVCNKEGLSKGSKTQRLLQNNVSRKVKSIYQTISARPDFNPHFFVPLCLREKQFRNENLF